MSGSVVHSLGTALAAGAGLAGSGAVASRTLRARAARRRRAVLLGAERRRSPCAPRWGAVARPVLRRWAVPCVAGLALAVLVGGPVGCLAGVVAGYAVRRRGRAVAARTVPEADRARRQLPLVAELLAACLAAGAAPGAAAEAVGRTVGGPLGGSLRRVAAEIRLGGDPARCWERLAALPDAHDLARWMARASTTGVAPVQAVARLAGEYRAAGARAAGSRARRAAVLATAPLGLCFLPAFLAVGVVPVVIGLAEVMTRGR